MKTLIVAILIASSHLTMSAVISFPIYTRLTNKFFPAVSGNNVAWRDDSLGGIYNYNINSGAHSKIANVNPFTGTDSFGEFGPNMGGNILVWENNKTICVHNFSSGTTWYEGGNSGYYNAVPKTDGNWTVWSNDGVVSGWNSSTQTALGSLSQHSYRPDIDGDLIVWQTVGDIQGHRLSTGQTFTVYSGPGEQGRPGISGDYVVWQEDYTNITVSLLSTGETFNVNSTVSGFRDFCAIDGDFVVWEDARNGNFDIYGYNLQTRQEFVICDAPGNQQWPAIDNGLVVWSDYRSDGNGYAQIYGAYIPEPSFLNLFSLSFILFLRRRRN